jgi:hypothetical protein
MGFLLRLCFILPYLGDMSSALFQYRGIVNHPMIDLYTVIILLSKIVLTGKLYNPLLTQQGRMC